MEIVVIVNSLKSRNLGIPHSLSPLKSVRVTILGQRTAQGLTHYCFSDMKAEPSTEVKGKKICTIQQRGLELHWFMTITTHAGTFKNNTKNMYLHDIQEVN